MKQPLRPVGSCSGVVCLILCLLGWIELRPIQAQSLPVLEIRSDGADLLLTWPANADGFRLETTGRLSAGTSWELVPETPELNGNASFLKLLAGEAARFYRLASFGSSPALTGAGLDTAIVSLTTPASLRFRYADPDNDLSLIGITRSNWTGVATERIPAALLGVTGASGVFEQVLPISSLAFGPNTICVWLEDATGHASARSCLDLVLGGDGRGTPPQLGTLVPAAIQQRLPLSPGKLVREFALTWKDPDDDVERVRVRIARPNGAVQATELAARPLGIIGPGGTVQVPLLTLQATDETGSYSLEVSLVDGSGQIGNTVTAVVTASLDSGEEHLRVLNAVVDSGAAPSNRLLLISGIGFEPEPPQTNRVQLHGRDLVVLSATPSTLTAVLPDDAAPGRVRVSNRRGSAWSPQPLHGLPLELTLAPANPVLAPGASQTFTALLNGQPIPKLEWSVNDIPGGNAEVGFISASGEFVAPAARPANGRVTVMAASPDYEIAAETTVGLPAPPPLVDTGPIPAEQGGTITSEDGRALAELPPNALTEDAVVSLRLFQEPAWRRAPPGRQVLAAFELTARPAQAAPAAARGIGLQNVVPTLLRAPALVTVPLANAQPPGGNPIPNLEVSIGGAPFESVPVAVTDDGNALHLLLPALGEVIIVIPILELPQPAPVLGPLSVCGRLEEGRATAVRFSGQNLTQDLQAEILTEQGQPTTDVAPGTLHLRGNDGGITLHCRTIRDLGENQSRQYQLVLRRPDGASVTAPFAVAGHNELFLNPGQRLLWTNDSTVRYSEIEIPTGATVEIAKPRLEGSSLVGGIRQGGNLLGGVLRWESTGRIRINGQIDGRGGPGSPGTRSNGGGPGGSFGPGGAVGALAGSGGLGRSGSDCSGVVQWQLEPTGYLTFGNVDSSCLFLLERSIGDSASDRSARSREGWDYFHRHGFGGLAGANVSILEDIAVIVRVFANVVSTAFNFASCLTTGTTCATLLPNAGQTIDGVSDLLEHFHSNASRGEPGHPGEPASLSGQLRGHGGGGGGGGGRYNYIFGTDPGGGGGGGGGGGRGVLMIAAGDVTLGGAMDTRGGNGGDGSEDGDFVPRPGQPPVPGRFSGGAGGGGSGGDIEIRALGRAFVPTALVTSAGGSSGISGVVVPHAGNQYLVVDPSLAPASSGRLDARPAPRTASRELVVSERLYPVSGSGLASPATLVIRAEDGATRRVTVTPGQNTQLTLFDGFNRIFDERDEAGSDLLHRCVLYLPEGAASVLPDDADGDSFPDAIERAFGSNPANRMSTPLNSTLGSGVSRGLIGAKPSHARVVRPAFGSAQGAAPHVVVATARGLRVLRPTFDSSGGFPGSVVMATPGNLRVVRPAIGPATGLPYSVFLSQPPWVRVFRP